MPGRPLDKIKRIADLCEWHKELAVDFDKALPPMYRYNGEADTGDARRDAWADCGSIVMTGAALTKLEAVLRSAAIERAKPRGKPTKYTRVGHDAGKDERIGTPMYADE